MVKAEIKIVVSCPCHYCWVDSVLLCGQSDDETNFSFLYLFSYGWPTVI